MHHVTVTAVPALPSIGASRRRLDLTTVPSSPQVPILAGGDHSQGGDARSEARYDFDCDLSGQQDRLARGRTAQPLRQVRSLGSVTAGPPSGGCGVTVRRQSPAPHPAPARWPIPAAVPAAWRHANLTRGLLHRP